MKLNANEAPATVGLVNEVRKELKSDIASLEYKMKSEFKKVDARFDEMDSKLEKVNSSVQAIAVSVEQMRIENRMMLASKSDSLNSRAMPAMQEHPMPQLKIIHQ